MMYADALLCGVVPPSCFSGKAMNKTGEIKRFILMAIEMAQQLRELVVPTPVPRHLGIDDLYWPPQAPVHT